MGPFPFSPIFPCLPGNTISYRNNSLLSNSLSLVGNGLGRSVGRDCRLGGRVKTLPYTCVFVGTPVPGCPFPGRGPFPSVGPHSQWGRQAWNHLIRPHYECGPTERRPRRPVKAPSYCRGRRPRRPVGSISIGTGRRGRRPLRYPFGRAPFAMGPFPCLELGDGLCPPPFFCSVAGLCQAADLRAFGVPGDPQRDGIALHLCQGIAANQGHAVGLQADVAQRDGFHLDACLLLSS